MKTAAPYDVGMKTVLICGRHQPPEELRHIVERGSTEFIQVSSANDAPRDVDRIVEWNGRELVFEDRRLRWPEDEDEVRLLFQTGG
jgi:hypothetical protein